MSALAEQLGVDKSTASRLLATLMTHGYAARLPSRRFVLSGHALRLLAPWFAPLIQQAAPSMALVAAAAGETVYLLQLAGAEAVTVTRVYATRRTADDSETLPAFPLWPTAGGRALLAALPTGARRRLLPAEPYPQFTPHTCSTYADLTVALRRGMRDGAHVEDGEFTPGYACVAAPVVPGRLGAPMSLTVSFESTRHGRDRAHIRQTLLRVAGELSSRFVAAA